MLIYGKMPKKERSASFGSCSHELDYIATSEISALVIELQMITNPGTSTISSMM